MFIIYRIRNYIIAHKVTGVFIFLSYIACVILFCIFLDKYSDLGEFLIMNGFALVFIVIGVLMYFNGFKSLVRKRLLENIPRSKIGSLALGLVEIAGVARPGESILKAPVSGLDCVFYKDQNTLKDGVVKTVYSDSPFYLEDSTGKILIDPNKAELLLGNPSYSENESLEWFIEPGDQINILGTALSKDSNDKFYKELRALKNDPNELSKVDTDKNGVISNEEWDTAVNKIKEHLFQERMKQQVESSSNNLIIGKGFEDRIYIISDKNAEELSKLLKRKMILRVIGGSVFSVIATAHIVFFSVNNNRELQMAVVAALAPIGAVSLGLIIMLSRSPEHDTYDL